MKLLVSACLLGQKVRYDGRSNERLTLNEALKNHEVFAFCPEVQGGLTIPRDPAEIQKNRDFHKERLEIIQTNKGKDVSKEFLKGAQEALNLCQREGIQVAILKERSPSCGVHIIYDGSFQGVKIQGQGITTRLLREAGITVYSDEEEALIKLLETKS